MFLQARAEAHRQLTQVIAQLAPELGDADVNRLAIYALAGGDGLFIAKEVGGDSVDLIGYLELHARTMVDIARRLIASAT
jgi:hypothetical protein